MSQRPVTTSGEVAVLRILAESSDLRWYRPIDVAKKMDTAFPLMLIRSALNRLRRLDFAAVHYNRVETFYAITTLGESHLKEIDQLDLFRAA